MKKITIFPVLFFLLIGVSARAEPNEQQAMPSLDEINQAFQKGPPFPEKITKAFEQLRKEAAEKTSVDHAVPPGITQKYIKCVKKYNETPAVWIVAQCESEEQDRQQRRLDAAYQKLMTLLKVSSQKRLADAIPGTGSFQDAVEDSKTQQHKLVGAQRAWLALQGADGAMEDVLVRGGGEPSQLDDITAGEWGLFRLAERANKLMKWIGYVTDDDEECTYSDAGKGQVICKRGK